MTGMPFTLARAPSCTRRPLVWTKCDMDVPDDQSFTVEDKAPAITCPERLAAIG
jgi:hypothetical protein